MKNHHFFKINWIDFPNKSRRVEGVYLIGNCYVGASTHIRKRILNHLCHIYSTSYKCFTNKKGVNINLDNYLIDCIKNNILIDVKYLSNNINDEKKFYIEYGIKISNNTRFLKK